MRTEMKSKTMVGVIVLLTLSASAVVASNETVPTKLKTPDGSPAANAVVFSVNKLQRPLKMVNRGAKFLPSPIDASAREIIGTEDRSEFSGAHADEDGVVQLDRQNCAHLVVDQSGDAMAFVPRGSQGDVHLRKCGRVQMDYSLIQKVFLRQAQDSIARNPGSIDNPIRGSHSQPPVIDVKKVMQEGLKDVVVIANWKNSLAGTYAVVESELDEYRLYEWFEVQFLFDEPQAEVAVPPGEVSVGLLSKEQVEEMCKFRFEKSEVLLHKTLRGLCVSSGIHSVQSGQTINPLALFGVCASGRISQRQKYPKWEQNKIFEGGSVSGSAMNIPVPSSFALKNPDNYVDWLLTKEGILRRIRIANQVAWFNNDGTFMTPPYASSSYSFAFFPSLENQPQSLRNKGHRIGRRLVDQEDRAIQLEVSDLPTPQKMIVDFGDVLPEKAPLPPTTAIDAPNRSKPINSSVGTFRSKPIQSELPQRSASASGQPGNKPTNVFPPVRPVVNRKDSASTFRREVEQDVRTKIDERKKQLLKLEERLKSARERLRKREKNIEEYIEQQMKKRLKSSADEAKTLSFYLSVIR